MRKTILLIVFALLPVSCAWRSVSTLTRSELLMPQEGGQLRLILPVTLKYYGSDGRYDYFMRGETRCRVLRREQAIPGAVRTPFNDWQKGRGYMECLSAAVSPRN